MIDTIIGKILGYVDNFMNFFVKYQHILVFGIVAVMVAKLAKVKVNLGG